MLRPYSLPLVASFTVVVLLLAACSGSSDESADTTLAPTTTEQATTTTANVPRGEIFEVTYTGMGCTVAGPSEVETGEHSFILRDETGELEAVYASRLDADKTLQDLKESQPAPGRWHPKPSWAHYTGDVDNWLVDDGELFVIRMSIPGEHVVLASLYYNVPEDERLHWYCSPTFEVITASG